MLVAPVKVNVIAPKPMTSPSCRGQGAVIRLPLTVVPLALPRSRITNCLSCQAMVAWRRETSWSEIEMSLSVRRPMLIVSLLAVNRCPGKGPCFIVKVTECAGLLPMSVSVLFGFTFGYLLLQLTHSQYRSELYRVRCRRQEGGGQSEYGRGNWQ